MTTATTTFDDVARLFRAELAPGGFQTRYRFWSFDVTVEWQGSPLSGFARTPCYRFDHPDATGGGAVRTSLAGAVDQIRRYWVSHGQWQMLVSGYLTNMTVGGHVAPPPIGYFWLRSQALNLDPRPSGINSAIDPEGWSIAIGCLYKANPYPVIDYLIERGATHLQEVLDWENNPHIF